MAEMRIPCTRCGEGKKVSDMQFLTLPYKKGYPDIIGLCPDCFKEFEAFVYYKGTETDDVKGGAV